MSPKTVHYAALDPRVGKNILNLWMVQVRPGKEKEDNLLFDQSNNYPSFFSLSEYDIICLAPNNQPLKGSYANGILDHQQVLCFPWVLKNYPKSDFNQPTIDHYQATTISFIKLKERLAGNQGVKDEVEFVKQLSDKLKNSSIPHHKIFGTMGLPELVLMLNGNNLQYLLEKLRDLLHDSHKMSPGITFFHTFPCIKSELAQMCFNNQLNAKHPSLGEVYWRITVTCNPSHLTQCVDKLHKLEKTYGYSVLSTYGKRDLEIIPDNYRKTSVEILLQVLGAVRAINKECVELNNKSMADDWIISTHTMLSVDSKEIPLQNNTQEKVIGPIRNIEYESEENQHNKILDDYKNRLRKHFKILNDLVKIENKYDNPSIKIADSVNRMIQRTQSLLENPGLADLGLDTIEYVLWVLDNLTLFINEVRNRPGGQNLTPPIRQRFLDFDELIRAYLYGLNQRLIGIHFSESDPAQSFSGIHGLGIQRYLRAVNAIPRALHSGFTNSNQEDWHGFTVFDYYPNTLILANHIINMPFSNINDPSQWWGLGHETGHAFCMSSGALERPYIQDLAKKLFQDTGFSTLGISPYEFVEELIATAFEYQFCYRGDFELHLEALWRFFNYYLAGRNDGVKKTTEYFIRTVFTFFYHLEQDKRLIPGVSVQDHIRRGKEEKTLYKWPSFEEGVIYRAWGEKNSIQEVIDTELIVQIIRFADKLKFELKNLDMDLIEHIYSLCEDLRTEILEIFSDYSKGRLLNNNLLSHCEMVRKSLDNGEILEFKNQMDLFQIPLALSDSSKSKEHSSVSEQAKIAAVLTLWHWDRLETGKRLKDRLLIINNHIG